MNLENKKSLQINEFNMNSNVASTSSGQHIYNRIIIPNDHASIDNIHACVVHKGKKLNYVCSINPCKLSKISGKITDLAGLSMYNELGVPSNISDGGKLHYVSLTAGASQHVVKGSYFGWDAGADSTADTKFSVAFDMQEGSTDLYFYSNGGTVSPATGASLTQISMSTSTTPIATGLDTLTADVSTYRVGDFPRFIAEFVIVARD